MLVYRVKKTDAAMIAQFGRPDLSKAFEKDGLLWVPFSNVKLWMIESLSKGARRT